MNTLELIYLYNNLGVEGIEKIVSLCTKQKGLVYMTDRMVSRLFGGNINGVSKEKISVPLYNIGYITREGKRLKNTDASIEEMNMMKERGLLIPCRSIREYKSVGVVGVSEEEIKTCIGESTIINCFSKLGVAIDRRVILDVKDNISNIARVAGAEYPDDVADVIIGEQPLDRIIKDKKAIEAMVEVMWQLGNIAGQRYLITYRDAEFGNMIEELVSTMEANYIQRLKNN